MILQCILPSGIIIILLRRVENVRRIFDVLSVDIATPPDNCKHFTERIIINKKSIKLLIFVTLISTLIKITLSYVCIDYSTLFNNSSVNAPDISEAHTVRTFRIYTRYICATHPKTSHETTSHSHFSQLLSTTPKMGLI